MKFYDLQAEEKERIREAEFRQMLREITLIREGVDLIRQGTDANNALIMGVLIK